MEGGIKGYAKWPFQGVSMGPFQSEPSIVGTSNLSNRAFHFHFHTYKGLYGSFIPSIFQMERSLRSNQASKGVRGPLMESFAKMIYRISKFILFLGK